MRVKWGFAEIQHQVQLNLGTAQDKLDAKQMMADAATLQPQWWRLNAAWNYIALAKDPGAATFDAVNNVPTTANRNWAVIDCCINDHLYAGTQIILNVGQGRPTWGGGLFGWGTTTAGPSDFQNFVAELATRYKPGGVGIRTDGKYAINAGKGVTAYECWNEPNSIVSSPNAAVDPATFVQYLQTGHAGLKSVLPGTQSKWILGGLEHIGRVGMYWGYGYLVLDELTYLTDCFNAVAAPDSLLNYFDVLAEHFYPLTDIANSSIGATAGPAPSTTVDNYLQLVAMRNLIVSKGGSQPIWITECGYSTQPGYSGGVTEAQQSTYIQQCFALFEALSWIEVALVYNVRDTSTATPLNDTLGAERRDFTKRPLWSYLQTLSPIFATGTINFTPSLSGPGVQGGIGSGAVSLLPTISATGKEKYNAGGTVSIPLSISATGVEKYVANGTITLPLAITGPGGSNLPGAGTITLTPIVSATGAERYIASGTITLVPVVSGTGAEKYSATGTVTFTPVISGGGLEKEAGAGTISISLSITGTGKEQESATGTVSIPLSFSGTGTTAGQAAGTLTMPLAISGTGAEKYTASGTITLTPVVTGTGAEKYSATGTVTLTPTVSGTGKELYPRSGTVSLTPTLSAGGSEKYSAAGTITVTPSITGTGKEKYSRADTITMPLSITATGVAQQMKAFWIGMAPVIPSIATYFNTVNATNLHGWVSTEGVNSQDPAIPLSDDIAVTKVSLWVTNQPGVGNSWTLTIRDNAANTSAAVTVSGANNTASWTGNVALSQLHLIDVGLAPSGSPTSPGNIYWTIEYYTKSVSFLMPMSTLQSDQQSNATVYFTPQGGSNQIATATGTDQEILIPTDCTVTKVAAYYPFAPGTGNTNTVVARKNNTSDSAFSAVLTGAVNKAVSGAGSGLVFAPGDTMVMKETKGPSSAWSYVATCLTIVPTNIGEIIQGFGNLQAPSTSAVNYEQPQGIGNNGWASAETNAAVRCNGATLKKLYAKFNTAPGGAASQAVKIRSNSADTTVVATTTGAATTASDTTHSATHGDGNLLSISCNPSGSPAASNGSKIGFVLVPT